ncbi:MAG: C1 family peptidase [Acidimicrobiia bacterium]
MRAATATKTRRILNCLPSPHPEHDWGIHAAVRAGVITAAPAKLPSSKDLRDDSWWPIGDQEATGSCVGWATADSVLRWHFSTRGRIQKGEQLSVRYLWMAAKETDEYTDRPTSFIEPDGTSLKAALNIARNYGVVPEEVLPFDSGDLYPDDVDTFYALAAQLRIATYHNLGRDHSDWQHWIATQGPILTRLVCDDTWMNAEATNGNLKTFHPATAENGHAVALVGYTPTTFIVRNSWGTSEWGDQGYGYATTTYAASAFVEAYGVTL